MSDPHDHLATNRRLEALLQQAAAADGLTNESRARLRSRLGLSRHAGESQASATASAALDSVPLASLPQPDARQVAGDDTTRQPPPATPLRRQWLELAAGIAAIVLVGALLVAVFRGMGGAGEADPGGLRPAGAADPAQPALVAADTCAVTPTGSAPPDLGQAAFTDTWYAGDGLWAGLGPELEGIWGEGHNRVLWWRQNPQPLEITGKRLDADAPPLEARIFGGYAGMSHQVTSVIFPTPGCWEVSATSGEQQLTLTLNVVPYAETIPGQRDQELNARYAALREEQTPYPVPDTCPVTSWIGPDVLGIGIPDARYRIDGDGLTLGQDLGLLFDGVANTVYWIAGPEVAMDDALRGAIQVDGRHALDPYARVRSEVGEQIGYQQVEGGMARSWFGKLTFPAAGCWTLQATIGPYVLDAVVYVYPLPARPHETPTDPGLLPPTPSTSERPTNPDIPWLTPEQEAEASALALDDPDVQALIAGIPDVHVQEVGLMHEGREQIGGAVVLRWDGPATIDGVWLTVRWDCVAEDSTLPYAVLRHQATYSNVTALIVHVDLRHGVVFGITPWPDAVAETIEWPPGSAECDDQQP